MEPDDAAATSPFGEVLLEEGLIDPDDLDAALGQQATEARAGHWELLGTVLVRGGRLTAEELEATLRLQSELRQVRHFGAPSHSSVHSLLKRAIDVCGALVGLGLTAVLLPFIAAAIALEDGGPVLFRQRRVTLHGRQFTIFKFRTMVRDADRLKPGVACANRRFFSPTRDARITRVGRVLRDTLLDELPQFWNVLRGEMSLVGTRPPTLDEVWRYDDRHWLRLGVRAGMTGMWQVSEGRHAQTFEEVVAHDLEYARRWSVALDALIICRTVWSAIRKVGHP
jgi:lipopolysaccharide/colanic/teichoic acid biosynthesis glycosyltransferase